MVTITGAAQPLERTIPPPEVGACYGYAWHRLWANFGALLLVSVVYFVMLMLVQVPSGILNGLIGSAAQGNALGTVLVAGLISVVYSLAVVTPASFGLLYAYLRAARGEKPDVNDIFAPFQRAWLSLIVATLVAGIAIMIGFLLLIIPGIFIAARLSFYPLIAIDERLGPMDALRASWERTRGHFWLIFLSWLLAGVITFVGLLLLLIGVIPASM